MNRPHYFEAGPIPGERRSERREYVAFGDAFTLVWRNIWLILVAVIIALGVAAAYYFVTPPTYRAQAQLLLDPKLPQIFREASDLGLNVDSAQIETHMVALKSRTVAAAVVDRLALWNDPEFQRRPSRLRALLPLPGNASASVDPDPARIAAEAFVENLSVEREGVSQVINVAYYSRDPEKAAALANETTRVYIQHLIEVRADAARTASEWLEQRLQELRLQMNAAAKRAQNFRATNESATLEELQLSAETYRKVYQDFYSAFTEAVQRESYPVTTARVISQAMAPLRASSPQPVLVFGAAVLLGGAAGLLLAIIRESRRTPRLRTRRGLEEGAA
ncbi:Wzz/FepE/Etk N-terminal domain-containing protein [Aestuariivirga sp.]|uniref:GumC family protein n=1 Tax=Aestuariivirga sp. TaxID=2650926 RepID=UPI00391BBDC4